MGAARSTSELHTRVRETILRWIKTTGITQDQVAKAIARSPMWLSRYLRGYYDTDLDTLDRLARVFNHSLAALLSVPDDPQERELISAYREAPPSGRKALLLIAAEIRRAGEAYAAAQARARERSLPPRRPDDPPE
jgi:transcriptional regulator with XRE-family HTH domain